MCPLTTCTLAFYIDLHRKVPHCPDHCSCVHIKYKDLDCIHFQPLFLEVHHQAMHKDVEAPKQYADNFDYTNSNLSIFAGRLSQSILFIER